MIALLLALGAPAGTADSGGVTATWWFEANDLVVLLDAPSEGWVAVGFNGAPELANSRLVMAAVVGGAPIAEEHLARPPEHPRQRALSVRAAEETAGRTRVLVSVPRAPVVEGTMTLAPGASCGLTLAYSAEDDFGHHSRWRGLLEIVL